MTKLNIGCGEEPLEGYINIDLHYEEYINKGIMGADAIYLPFKNESIDEIYMSHFLEHLSYELAGIGMYEWRRVLKFEGKIIIIVPDMDVIAKEWCTPPPKPYAPDAFTNTQFQMSFWNPAIYGSFRGKEQVHRSAWNAGIMTYFLINNYFTDIDLARKDFKFWLYAKATKGSPK